MYRLATMDDCKCVYDLICDMEKKILPYNAFFNIYKMQQHNPNYACILYEENTKILAMINLRFEEQLHHADKIVEIMELVVDSKHRNKQIGKSILKYAEEFAKEKGAIQIEVACNQLRLDTHRFYLKEKMNNYHYKFSKVLIGEQPKENKLGM